MKRTQNRFRLTPALLAVLLALGSSTAAVDARQSGDFVPHELVCSVVPGVYIDSINTRYGTTTKDVIDTGLFTYFSYLLSVPEELDVESLANEIALDSDVFYCAPNYMLDAPEPVQRSQPFLDVTGEPEVTEQAAATRLNLSTAQAQSTGTGVLVAVIDAGVDAAHPMLAGSVLSGIDYVDSDTTAHDEPGGAASGHGTFVAGVIHLVAPEAHIVPYRVIDTVGRGDGFSIAKAIIDAVARGCKVINISLVMSGTHASMDEAIEYARYRDVVVVGAAGNDSSSAPRFPAEDPYCVGVAALDSADLKADFSNFGPHIDLCAPGKDIKGPFLDNLFARWSGTSFAAPFVSGTAALLFAVRPAASFGDLVNLLKSTAEEVDALNPLYAGELGTGIVSPQAAVAAWWAAPGDVDASGVITSADIVYLINHVFKSGPPPTQPNNGDVDGSCVVSTGDVIYLVEYVFKGGASPEAGCVD